ncbi:MAG: PilZ domain-containing protein [Elusimicrobia bacterium]|nr:PilZ domain-containing protein [Elusimicrobiota bacterium]
MRAPLLVPALLRFPGSAARQDSWGRLLKVTAGGAELSTAARLAKGDVLQLQFELGGERMALPARVHHAYDDDDGQRVAELRWSDMVERRRLARALVGLLSRA